MASHRILLLTPEQAMARRAALVDLLIAVVEDGASVNFVLPMTREKAEGCWDGALADQARGERLIFIAESDERLDGTVHLVPAPQENQRHRADLAKMLVHPLAQRQGLGAALMRAAEEEARRIGRTLLTLDTETGSAGERLYARLGWTEVGEIPGYAMRADGSICDSASFFYKVLSAG
ncbi:GNAT family N-acetyltransferase [Dongia soli]|uniref:GNAT family N-acetyltransferase n=1 Tax=Dongia soli TaxID=600628 RepID=A0ABU5E867_9PROT|nr:GNAT family N-acetyltransferase [Dongia soli]MDY0882398.1 GNAT family N-acetyltransferase [Dongia soli]